MSAKSQARRLARKYPKKRKPRPWELLDWSGGAPGDPIAILHGVLEDSLFPVEAYIP